MLTVAVPKQNKLQNIIVLTPKDGSALGYSYNIFGNYAFMYDNGKILPKICLILRFQNKKIPVFRS